ncbi:alpha/beta hydrolase [Actinosynnema pretiosum]|uniref:Alpha/beta hydrolase n=1 Tax=Actinosynnema pretiosum TaxID=42197 RepID=A0A290ZD84_9PSEU|nr:alpha/beta hydrolase [Actinosynnema pretiosum]
MSVTPARYRQVRAVRGTLSSVREVVAEDGARLRTWRVDRGGPDVLLCAGLGVPEAAWPPFPAHLLGWHYRGTLGSSRPDDPARVRLADHVSDALRVLDAAGVERCPALGWSFGVTVAVELALRHPDRVSGLLLVAGPPGDVLGAVLGAPLLPWDRLGLDRLGLDRVLPERARRELARGGVRALRRVGPLLGAVLGRVPAPEVDLWAARVLGPLLRTDWAWFAELALALAETPTQDLSAVTCPTTAVVGRYDGLAAPSSLLGPVARLPQARCRVLPTTHFLLPLAHRDDLVAELALLLRRVDAVERAMAWAGRPLTPRSRPPA